MIHIPFKYIINENGEDNYYLYSPWLIENIYTAYSAKERYPWKWVYEPEDSFPTGIIFYNDEDATAFRLRFGL